MELYYLPMSTYCQKVLIALAEKNVSFESKLVNLMDPQAREEYREVFPLGKIPLLKPAPDHIVPESTIIVEYLEDHFPNQGTRLLPDDRDAARKVRLMDRMNDLYLLNHSGFLFFQNLKPESERDAERIADAERQFDLCLDYLNETLQDKQWLAGDTFSLADCSAIPALWLAQTSRPWQDKEHVAAYFERARERPSVAKVIAGAEPMLAQFKAQAAA